MAWLIVVLMVFCLPAISRAQTALAKAAAALSPGSWVSFPTTNFLNGDILRSVAQGGGSALEYADEGHWNPINGTVMILGASHFGATVPSPCPQQVFSKLTESNNTWSSLPTPCSVNEDTGPAHEYNHAAINPNTGDLYHRQYYSQKVMKFTHSTQTWSQCTPWGTGVFNVGGALEYFPERNSLVFLDGNWGVWELSLASGNCLGTWVQRASTSAGGFTPQLWPDPLGPYHNQSRYSSSCQCIVLGGGNGNNRLWRYYANGTWSQGASPPFGAFGVPFDKSGDVFTRDPVSGNILAWYFTNAGTTMYEYNPVTNIWTTISRNAPIFPGPDGDVSETFAIPISTYGVILFTQASSSLGGGSSVYLYKHLASVADTQAPTIPTGLTVTVISSTQINLSWNASTDNVGGSGVAGYSVRRCSPTACNPVNEVYTPTGTSQNDTGLTPNTPYGYSVAARDAAGNLSLYSPAVYATTLAAGGGADFATRCTASGVVRCFGFDTTADLGTIGSAAVGTNFGTFNNGVSNCPTTGASRCATIDTTVKAGGAGSMKFVIPTNSGSSGAGQWFTNFGSNQATLVPQFGSGQTFYIQWRQRFSSCYLFGGSAEPCSGPPRSYLGGGGWKIADISTGDVAGTCLPNGANCATSCSEIEIVWTTTSNRGVPQGYNGCPGTYGGLGGGSFVFEEPFGGSDFKLQNAYLIGGNPGWCPYSQLVVGGNRANCWSWTANEWLTFKVRVTLGKYQQTGCAGTEQWCYPNSTVEFWGGREGQPTTKIHSYTFALNGDDTGTETEKYGKIWLLPYNTGKDSSEVTPEGYTWYDELIISTQDIADPGATVIPPGTTSVTINQPAGCTGSSSACTTSASSVVLTGTATGPGF